MNETQIEYCYKCLCNKNKMTPHRKGYRVCGTCKVEKKYSEFHVNKGNAHGIHFRCKECTKIYNKKVYFSGKARNRGYKRKYKITLDDYNRMLKSQNNKCAICNGTATGHRINKYLSVDHCHTTGKIRGLLCFTCNIVIGHMKDDVELLEKAIDYLKGDE